MNLDDLEAAIWHQVPGLSSGYAPDRYAAMNAVLGHIGDYATAQCAIALMSPDLGEQAMRRAALEAATRPKRKRAAPPSGAGVGWGDPPVHFQKPSAGPAVAACHGRPTTAQVTPERGQVTCGSCTVSAAWRKAAA